MSPPTCKKHRVTELHTSRWVERNDTHRPAERGAPTPEQTDRSPLRFLFWAVAALGLLYVPLGFSYMWFAFDSGAPRLQEALNAAINGSSYGTGDWSVVGVRDSVYQDHRILMLTHTTLGAGALALAIAQLSPNLRRYRAVHRWIGRAYLTLMTTSMLAAIAFLTLAPAVPFPGQQAFRLQLWVLAISTLGSAWIGFVAIRRGDVVTHRAAMGFNVSFMMTAPLLRILWMVLAPVFPEHDLLTNLGVGAVLLAVLAPATGALGFMITDRNVRPPGSRSGTDGAVRVYLLLAVVMFAGLGLLWGWYAAISRDTGPSAYPWFHIVPIIAYVGVGAIGAARARNSADNHRERKWRLLIAGGALAPWAALLVAVAASVVYGPVEGYIAALMVGPGAPILMTFARVLHGVGQSVEAFTPADAPAARCATGAVAAVSRAEQR
jgi:hypothetical protein